MSISLSFSNQNNGISNELLFLEWYDDSDEIFMIYRNKIFASTLLIRYKGLKDNDVNQVRHGSIFRNPQLHDEARVLERKEKGGKPI